jgi:hypothetical protein
LTVHDGAYPDAAHDACREPRQRAAKQNMQSTCQAMMSRRDAVWKAMTSQAVTHQALFKSDENVSFAVGGLPVTGEPMIAGGIFADSAPETRSTLST